MTKIDLLNEYLLIKLRINPLGKVHWNTEDYFNACSITYYLSIDGFECGIKVTEGELLDYLIEKHYGKQNR